LETILRPPAELHELAARALISAGTARANAAAVADALIAAELDGIPSHGLARVPFYADQVSSGKIDGRAVPEVKKTAAAAVSVDARYGFAFPAIAAGFASAVPLSRGAGVVAVGIRNSHHCGVLGYHVERLAQQGLFSLGFANTPAAMAPWGGARPLFGTNPIAFACPRRTAEPLVVDLSVSVAARGKIMMAAGKNQPIPEGWALDEFGRPTTDARAALKGTVLPIGGAKGAALALMVELLSGALTQSRFGYEASSFFDAGGPPPGVGQLFVMLDTNSFGGDAVLGRVEDLCHAIALEAPARIPGERRLASRADVTAKGGISLPKELFEQLQLRAIDAEKDLARD
jgi:(2R)-3-sulfolactate dehydrogenase (NADP+)